MDKEKLFIRKYSPYSPYGPKYWTKYFLENENGDFLSQLSVEEECISDTLKYIPIHKGKKILYLTGFSTNEQFRNKGYGKYLLTKIINRYKGKYDMLHLNACPYYITQGNPIFEAPDNGLKIDNLINFYKQAGLEVYGECEYESNVNVTVMIMNL